MEVEVAKPTDERFDRLQRFLTAHFGEVTVPPRDDDEGLWVIDIHVDDLTARLDLISMGS
jgi:cleavage and polyadenylation specificity factor subunit 3